jgi:Holliday junction DNA helicase RuvA
LIAGIEGTVEFVGPESVVVRAGPVSFRVFVPKSRLPELGQLGGKVRLHTHLHVREDILALYGFVSQDELALFEELISVTGVGPKLGLTLLSSMAPDSLVQAILSENIDALCEVPGIGKKTASRLVLELKSKLEKGLGGVGLPILAAESTDVVAALTSLGYSLREATQAVAGLPQTPALSLEDKLRLALKRLSAS